MRYLTLPDNEHSGSSTCPDNTSKDASRTVDDKTQAQLQLIGTVLMICEASSAWVGVPWIFPSQRVRRLRETFEPPLDQFVRLALVEAPTIEIESYARKLQSSLNPSKPVSELFIDTPTFTERYAGSVVAFLLIGGIGYLLSYYLGSPPPLQILIALSIGALAGTELILLSGEMQRRQSFYQILNIELRRRRGEDIPNARRLSAAPA